ncbi:hypothetical protein ACWIDS_16380 [Dietzia maris]
MSINTRCGRTDAAVRTGIAARLVEIQTRAEQATDGPWEYRYLSPYKGGNVYEPSGYPLPGCTNCGDNEATYEEYDAEFIAHARTDVPTLHNALDDVLTYMDECERVGVSMHPADVRALIAAALGVTS